MLTTAHAVTGAAIGAILVEPAVVLPVALASHYFLDTIPHWQETLAPYVPNKYTYMRIPIDLLLSASLVYVVILLKGNHASIIIIGALVANLPDADTLLVPFPKLKRGILKKHWDWHSKIQRETSSLWGVVTQLITVAIDFMLVQFLRH
jgi:hypothetical protein